LLEFRAVQISRIFLSIHIQADYVDAVETNIQALTFWRDRFGAISFRISGRVFVDITCAVVNRSSDVYALAAFEFVGNCSAHCVQTLNIWSERNCRDGARKRDWLVLGDRSSVLAQKCYGSIHPRMTQGSIVTYTTPLSWWTRAITRDLSWEMVDGKCQEAKANVK
jgi:hypothetical protein